MSGRLIRKILCGFFLAFFLSLVLTGEPVQLEELYKWPFIIEVDEQKVYVVDKLLKKVTVYSRENFRPLIQFGRSGEGPGEFTNIMMAQVFPENIVVTTPIKISFFSHEGKFLREIKNPSLFPVMKLAKNLFVKRYHNDRISYEIWNEKFKKKKELYTVVSQNFPRDSRTHKLIVDLVAHRNQVAITREYIVVGNTREGFYFKVFDHDGRLLGEIRRKISPRRLTAEDERFIMNEHIAARKALNVWERDKVRKNFVFSDYFPAYNGFFVQDEKLYVFDYPTPDGKQGVSILSIKGQFLKRQVIPFIGGDYFDRGRYFIYKGVLYYLYDNVETEKWEIRDLKIE
jgi:hypothetical protein